jgi:hypothetical protein
MGVSTCGYRVVSECQGCVLIVEIGDGTKVSLERKIRHQVVDFVTALSEGWVIEV